MPWDAYRKNPAYWTPEYQRARDACLKAANWRCEIRVDGVCIRTASQADHIDGIASDPHHQRLRAACVPCHRHVTSRQGHAARHGSGDPDFTGSRTQW